MSSDTLREAARALMAAVERDEERAGGMIDRDTLRLASLLRIEINAADRRDAAPSWADMVIGLRSYADAFERTVVSIEGVPDDFARLFLKSSAECWRNQADAIEAGIKGRAST